MSLAARDPWADAWQVATQPVPDGGVVRVRRRIWARRIGGMVLVGAVLIGGAERLSSIITPDYDQLWPTPWSTVVVGFSVAGVGLVLMCVGAIRASGTDALLRAYVGPEDFLSRTERAWVRTQVREGTAVPGDRHDVVVATARRMAAEGRQTWTYLGLLLLYVGMIAGGPFLSTVIVFAVLGVWMAVRVVRALIWSRRARRWLDRYTDPAR